MNKNYLKIPVKIVNTSSLMSAKKERHNWKVYTKRLLYKVLAKTGSFGFIPVDLPLLKELPTMVIGISKSSKDGRYSLVASLNKEFCHFYKQNNIEDKYGLISHFHGALNAFHSYQRLIPRRVIVYRQT